MLEDLIKKKIYKDLELLESTGDIYWFERLQSGTVETKYGSWLKLCRRGTPDFICILQNKARMISVIFIEAKRSDGGTWSKEQQEWKNKNTGHPDIHYCLINDLKNLKSIILSIAYDRLGDIEL